MTIESIKKNIVFFTPLFANIAWKWTKWTTAGVALLGMTWVGATAVERYEQQQIQADVVFIERSEAYGQFGAEVHMLAQLIISEIGAYPNEWDEVTESVFGRIDSDMFPNTLEGVVKQVGISHWQFNGMGDKIPDLMVTEQGLTAIAFAEKALRKYYAGTYEFSLQGVHSFCVPSACKTASAYFDQFCVVAKREGHHYYGKSRTSPYAPCRTTRPEHRSDREQSVVFAEQDGKQTGAIELLVAQAIAEVD